MLEGGEIKLTRSNGFVSAAISPDGATWKSVGTPKELPAEFKTAPLKLGLRVKRNYKADFLMTVVPEIISDGAVDPAESPDLPALPSFESSNSDHTSTVTFDNAVVTMKTSNGADSAIMTQAAHQGDGPQSVIEITAKMESRVTFGSGYQGALSLFFAPPSADLSSVTANDNAWGSFASYVVSCVREKFYPTINHCWTYQTTKDPAGGPSITQNGGAGLRNDEGYLRLRRSAGFVEAAYSPNGITWYVGSSMELPDEYKTSPLKIGMNVKKEYKNEYELNVSPVIVSGGII